MLSYEPKVIACIGLSAPAYSLLENRLSSKFTFYSFKSYPDFYRSTGKNKAKLNAIISEGNLDGPFGFQLKKALEKSGYSNVPFTIIIEDHEILSIKQVMEQGIAEVFMKPLSAEKIGTKLEYLIDKPETKKTRDNTLIDEYHLPAGKRIFDILIASAVLLLLSPIFLIIAILIRLESKGPIFYYSLRVGTGYQIFRFYKFRSMSAGADAKLSQLKHLNQYTAPGGEATNNVKQKCEFCEQSGSLCTSSLYADNTMWCEKLYKKTQISKAGQAFVKIKDDPRVTRIGKFIRNTSIDELPQLWNVLKGDMSLVGNRPLPLYEAEKLTTDKYALRFIAPAGITGLWQVSKRGKGAMSEDERISLDNDYANSFGLLFDLKLILKTIPALFQKENV